MQRNYKSLKVFQTDKQMVFILKIVVAYILAMFCHPIG